MGQEFSPQQIEALLQYAAKRLHTTPQALKTAFEQGGLDGLFQQAQGVAGGRDVDTLLRDPQVAGLLRKLMEEHGWTT